MSDEPRQAEPDEEQLGAVLRALTAQGFIALKSRKQVRRFQGCLNCKLGEVPVVLEISDWDFLSYPKLIISNPPDFLPPHLAHLHQGSLCYFADGSAPLDRYNPAGAILRCLVQATSVIDDLISDPMKNIADIQEEFVSYWLLDNNIKFGSIFIGEVAPGSLNTRAYILKSDSATATVILDSAEAAEALAKSWSCEIAPKLKATCWLLETDHFPFVSEHPRPRTIKEMLVWLRNWDHGLYDKLKKHLETDANYLKTNGLFVGIKSPIGWLGFHLEIISTAKNLCNQANRNKGRRKGKLFLQHLHGAGGYQEITRLYIQDISPTYVHSRNLEYPDLRARKIALVGCGAIGGFLAQALVKLGAGTGQGYLKLIDPDLMKSDNLGRHFLGYPELRKLKAKALVETLRYQFPFSSIEGVIDSVDAEAELSSNDLIIDATGEESVSEMLNHRRLNLAESSAPVLHVWIRGNGETVQGLWAFERKWACYRCLRRSDIERYHEERFLVEKVPPRQSNIGCTAFTPYSVSAPMHAASLAVDMVIDWIKGDPSPRFRTRIIENADVHKVKSKNLEPLQGCPACRKK